MSKQSIRLGSGKVYIAEYNKETGIPETEALEVAENILGAIKNGASLEYNKETYTATDDLGTVKKTKIVSENAVLKCGVMTLNGETLAKLVSTAKVTKSSGSVVTEIGGVQNDDGKVYVVRFVQEDKADGALRITIIGKNNGSLALAFAKDSETVIDAEFIAEPMDTTGRLVRIEEEVKGEE